MKPLLRHLRDQWAGVLALLLVLTSGTAYAAHHVKLPKNSVASKQVKNGSLAGKDLKDGSVTGADVADGSLTKQDLAPGTVPPVPTVLATNVVLTVGADTPLLTVPGMGTLRAECDAPNTKVFTFALPAGLTGRTEFGYYSTLGPGAADGFHDFDGSAYTVASGGAPLVNLIGYLYVSTPSQMMHVSIHMGAIASGVCRVEAEALVTPAA